MSPRGPSPWIREAAALPVAFAQVREDALLDLEVVHRIRPRARVIMVASGGCTAAALAASGRLSQLLLVDPNPAQLALTRLKLQLLQTASPLDRGRLLGHARWAPSKRADRLKQELDRLGVAPETLGPRDLLAERGPDHAGRYEIVFSELRRTLSRRSDELAALLRRREPSRQKDRVSPTTRLGRALDEALEEVMSLPNLVGLFGRAATGNQRQPFSRHFAGRIRHVLATLPAAGNPYLSQMLLGRFSAGIGYPWLAAHAPARMPEIVASLSDMAGALREHPGESDLVHLSNILDWLSEDDARRTLDLAWKALRPGGCVIIRQLNSTLDIPALGARFKWRSAYARALQARDRSFFYQQLFVGGVT